MHVDRPVKSENFPSVHDVQVAADNTPVAVEKVPAAHFAQDDPAAV